MGKEMVLGYANSLGQQLSKKQNTKEFNISSILSTYGSSGTFYIYNQRPTETEGYLVVNTNYYVEGDLLKWIITDTETGIAGRGKVQIRYEINSIIVMSEVYATVVEASVNIGSTVPQPWTPWVTVLTELKDKAEAAVSHYPQINATNYHWMVWDATNSQWVDTGVVAKGDITINHIANGTPDYSVLQTNLNNTVTTGSIAFGSGCTAGAKGYYISNIDFTNRKIYISSATTPSVPTSGTGTVDTTFTAPAWSVGDFLCFKNSNDYVNKCKIASINHNEITIDRDFSAANSLPTAIITVASPVYNDYALFSSTHPLIGLVDVSRFDFTEGVSNQAIGTYAHAEGGGSQAIGAYSHAEGVETTAYYASHAEGRSTVASGERSHAEGTSTTASGDHAHAEGYGSLASGNRSHAEGNGTHTTALFAHAEGTNTTASGSAAHTEGQNTLASGDRAHAEGYGSQATAANAHAEGNTSKATGASTHAEGDHTNAKATGAHSEGYWTNANSAYSHAEGKGTAASLEAQHVEGTYNISDATNLIHIVGNGTSSSRSNAHTLSKTGEAWFAGDVYTGSTSGTNKDAGSKKLATEELVNTKEPIISATHKIFADYVDDNNATHRFLSDAEKIALRSAMNRNGIGYGHAGGGSQINTISWDGNTSGKTAFESYYYVYDYAPDDYEIFDSIYTASGVEYSGVAYEDLSAEYGADPGVILRCQGVDLNGEYADLRYIIFTEAYTYEEVEYPSGVYFEKSGSSYVSRLVYADDEAIEKISSDMVDDTNHTNKFLSATNKAYLDTSFANAGIGYITHDTDTMTWGGGTIGVIKLPPYYSYFVSSTAIPTDGILGSIINSTYTVNQTYDWSSYFYQSTGTVIQGYNNAKGQTLSFTVVYKSFTYNGVVYPIGTYFSKYYSYSWVNSVKYNWDHYHQINSDFVSDTNQTHKFIEESERTTWNNKQEKLTSGSNIKTINNQSILGSGNINITSGVSSVNGKTGTVTLAANDVGAVADVRINNTSIVSNNVANLTVADNYSTTSTTAALSAARGRDLNDRLQNVEARGRFLSTWNSRIGLPGTDPSTIPYTYKTGDYYIVSRIASTGYVHSLYLTGLDYSGTSYNVRFSLTTDSSTVFTSATDIISTLVAQGHTGHSGTCTATGKCGSHTLGYVAADGTTSILLQTSTTEAIGMLLPNQGSTTINIVDVVYSKAGYNHTINIQYDSLNATIVLVTSSSTSMTDLATIIATMYELGYDTSHEKTLPATGTYMSTALQFAQSNQSAGEISFWGSQSDCTLSAEDEAEISDTITERTAVNYAPSGDEYDGTYSTAVETNDVAVNDTYIFDGGAWTLLHSSGTAAVTFGSIAGQPTDNTNLASALNAKQNSITSSNQLSSDYVSDTNNTHKFVTESEKSTWNAKQSALTTTNKLASDLVSDTNQTNQFVTSADKAALESAILNAGIGYTASSSGSITWDGDTTGLTPVFGLYPVSSSTIAADLLMMSTFTKFDGSTTSQIQIQSVTDMSLDFGAEAGSVYGATDTDNQTVCMMVYTQFTYEGTTAPVGSYFYKSGNTYTNAVSYNYSATNKISSDMVDDSGHTNKFVTDSEKSTWSAKYTKPASGIPSSDLADGVVNNAVLTIQKNGTTVATFSANASTAQTANITVPTQASDLGITEYTAAEVDTLWDSI